ncbi:hypothetical protein [Cellulomonas fengjieae]|uniref:Membrane protein YmcC n=1 Tax=Cellulomonas fengjieae TaxID=2819978 RepID=A0ABS3SHM3_9CELL|nr:hypothetical protein [Cellulomonas fengjieae]MBO3085245.1 hypothetical protein [Cellulomonas fengjieae]MBO3100992.1 hypothetical protein [Cellulomonas fengjieae]QVI66190.1 hypothetical protein KG102_00720 [Cellulomonas fengjieae]
MIDAITQNPVAALVVACEVAFWVFLAAAVVARYALHLRRTSTVLLLCEPLLEVILLVATVGDLLRGAEPTWTHGLAALYLGFTVGFGKLTVHTVDAWVAHRFAGGPAPEPRPRTGAASRSYEWRLWGRVVVAWGVACGVLAVLMLIATEPEQREVLLGWAGRASIVLVGWLVSGPLWQEISSRGRAESVSSR